jgi:hypothetical protein
VAKWKESETMAYPGPAHSGSNPSSIPATIPSANPSGNPPGFAGVAAAAAAAACTPHHRTAGASRAYPTLALRNCDGEHQLEKLQFALAVALTRGDRERERRLREQIAALGGNSEEPGT